MSTYARICARYYVHTHARTHSHKQGHTHTHRIAVDEDALPILDGELRMLCQQVQFAATAKSRRCALVPAASAYTGTYVHYMYMYVCSMYNYI